jgi:multiple sugar transport system permease protein
MRGTEILKDRTYGLLIALPAILVLVLIIIFPMLYSLYLSFVPLELLNPGAPRRFVGLQSYLAVLKDYRFTSSLLHTLVFVCITMTVEFLLGLGIALLLNQSQLKGRGLLRTLLVLPLMVAPIVSGLQWRWIFADQYGILNYILGVLRLPAPVWLGSQVTAMTAIVVANLWVATPFVFMVLLAGLQGMPGEPIEAGIIDGAGWFQRLWYIILPLLRPAIRVVLLIRLADAIRIFDIVYILTGGGPGDSTQVFSTYIFRVSYGNLDLSQGAAGSFIMVCITAIISLIVARRFGSARG